ncbi:hypothetical protein [Janthinobacterium sp. LB3P118]|uniref:hypothetical protein n=1 Tax=Janthinobacterium sp. LB3P118 TaxID=3424195 RepID=UPI003F1E54BF
MRKQKKPSAYTQKRAGSNVTDFVAEKIAKSYRVEHHEEPSGPTLKLVVPFKPAPGGEKSIDISFLLDFPMLWEPFSQALALPARLVASPFVTVNGKVRNLKNGLVKYLRVAAPDAGLGDITTDVFERFIIWLRRTENGAAKYKKMSKQHFEMTASAVMRYLQKSDGWKEQLSPELHIRKNYWIGEPDDRTQVKIIPEEDYRDIYVACKKEITATMTKVRHQRALMQAQLDNPIALQGDIFPGEAYHPCGKFNNSIWKTNPYKDLGLCLAALRHRVPGVILSITRLKKMQDKMLLRVVEGTQPFGSIPQLHYCFYPYARELVPFVLMLAIHLDYNPETLLQSLLHDYVIRKNEIGSIELVASPANINREKKEALDASGEREPAELEILARAKKGRSNNAAQSQIRPATDDLDNPASIVQFLKEWTSFSRPLVPPAERERLFIFATEQRDRIFKSFVGTSTATSDNAWRNSLKRFYDDHGLPQTALNRFRPTGLDFTDVLFGGDIRAKQAAANHASPETTYRLYSTDAQKQRGDEFLGQVGLLRRRWRESRGKVDPRNKPSSSDVGAATPGWTCVDPFSGPYTPNKLCNSYGSCPGCPHGSIALDDPYALAQAWNLLYAIDEAAVEIAPDAWLTRWAPIKEKLLKIWLPSFPDLIQEQAKRIKLAKLPPLE